VRFLKDVEKYQWQITRSSSMLMERMGTYLPIHGHQVEAATPSACVLVGRYVFLLISFAMFLPLDAVKCMVENICSHPIVNLGFGGPFSQWKK
jgi:hypothetical protein